MTEEKLDKSKRLCRIHTRLKNIILCPECKGKGYVKVWRETVELTGYAKILCPECEGDGRIYEIITIQKKLLSEEKED